MIGPTRNQKKGQFEIMGLAVIIILVILAGSFFLFVPHRDPTLDARAYANEQLAQNAVDAFLKTDVIDDSSGSTCDGTTQVRMYDLVRDIALLNQGLCDDTGTSAKSKIILEKEAEALFGNSTGYRFNFLIYKETSPTTPLLEITHCSPRAQFDRAGEQRLRLLPSDETAVVQLRICPEER